MTDTFLKAKHWQIFILTFVLPLLLELVLLAGIFSTIINAIVSKREPDMDTVFAYYRFFPLIMILFTAGLFYWYWSVAIGLQHRVPQRVRLKTKRFKWFFFIPVVYLLALSIFLFVAMGTFLRPDVVPDPRLIGLSMLLVIPLHLFSIFCIFHSIYFVAKTLKTVELQREADFGDFVLEFFLVWFFPIGIWFLQPRINKILEKADGIQPL